MNILLDLDGTILNSRQRLHRLFCHLLPDNDLDEDAYWELKRHPRSHAWLLQERYGMSGPAIDRFEADWLALIETEEYLALDVPFAGATETLAALREHGGLHLLTARRYPAAAEAQVARLGLTPFFTSILVTGPGRSKPDTVRAAGLTPLAPDDMMVGDTGEDIATGKELGIVTIGLTGGFRAPAYLAQRGADALYDSLADFASRHFG